MSILQHDIHGARVLDLFAGSGALGLEALSRGAASATFVEESARSLRTLKENIEALGAGDRAIVQRGDALRFIRDLPDDSYGIAFADPPYGRGLAAAVAERWLERPFASVLGIEHESRISLPGGGEARRYGDTTLTFFRAAAPG